jgi:predicted nucleic acid-binding protein
MKSLITIVDLFIAQIAIENILILLHNNRDIDAIVSISSLKIYKPTIKA